MRGDEGEKQTPMTLSSFCIELGEGDVQVPVAKLWQSSALDRGHQAARESPPPGVGVEPRAPGPGVPFRPPLLC